MAVSTLRVALQTEDSALREVLSRLAPCGWEETSPQSAQVVVRAAPVQSGLTVHAENGRAKIGYSRRVEFARGLSLVKESVLSGRPVSVREASRFRSNGLMLDCSRNAVPRVQTVCELLRCMALMGLDTLQLYTEDTYTLDNRPYFGYMRGRYSDSELREIDAFADALGIEIVPCIQTLAHLKTVLRWDAFSPLADTPDILMAGEEETYRLAEEMIVKMRRVFHSRRINIGMDEAYMLGLGRYREKHGVRDSRQIMREHLQRVTEICRRYGFRPMMWSDMFFHTAQGAYGGAEESDLRAVSEQIPPDVTLIYWEYYCRDPEKYEQVLRRHLALGRPVAFAGCAWKWNGLLPEIAHSLRVSRMALGKCLQTGVTDVFATAWGDDGAECPLMTILPVLQLYAEIGYRGAEVSEDALKSRFAACTDGVWEDFLLLDTPNRTTGDQPVIGLNPTKYLLYQDVLQGLFDKHVGEEFPAFFARCREQLLEAERRNPLYGYLFAFEAALCDVLSVKCDAGKILREAYLARDRETLSRYAECVLPCAEEKLNAFTDVFYTGWMRDNKPFGFDVIDIRLGGVRNRLITAQKRLRAFLAGETDVLEEWEENRLFFDNRADPAADINTFCNTYSRIATASVM